VYSRLKYLPVYLKAAVKRYTDLNAPNVENRDPTSTYTTASSKRGIFSSLQFREQAADLMAQIRNDVRNQKRLYSHGSAATPIRQGPEYDPGMDSVGSVDIEPIDYGDDTEDISDVGADFTETLDIHPGMMQPAQDAGIGSADEYDLTRSVGELSLDSPSLIHHFPPLPVAIVVSSSPTPSIMSTEDAAPSMGRENSKPAYLAPLALPSTSTRPGVNTNDLNRFVSSSTASGVTGGSGTTTSIVRHEGRPIKLITPDSQLIPDRLGEMMFDQRLMKWVKASALSREVHPAGTSMRANDSHESEDPFHDIESLREEADPVVVEDVKQDKPLASNGGGSQVRRIRNPPSDSEGEDAEEAGLNCFSFDSNFLQDNRVPPPVVHEKESALDTDSEEDIDIGRSESTTDQFVRALAHSSAEP
jgi:protein NUD1